MFMPFGLLVKLLTLPFKLLGRVANAGHRPRLRHR
jgi:hypothetical protein